MNTKEIMALIERYRAGEWRDGHSGRKAELERVLGEVCVDALRYKWLRGAQTLLTEELFDIKVDAGMRGEE